METFRRNQPEATVVREDVEALEDDDVGVPDDDVLVGDDVYVGRETFNTSEEAIAVAKARARLRERNG